MFIGTGIKAPPATGSHFNVMKRERDGTVHRIGSTRADNKTQADFKARAIYKPREGEAVWCELVVVAETERESIWL